ncbi:MAG: hypothetical protein MK132_07115 [Lentisphaerales bacterium]|nr:hypothetical protein [Lentisphaerales bacterium]
MDCLEKSKDEIVKVLHEMDSETLVKELREARRKTIEIILFQHNQIADLNNRLIGVKSEPSAPKEVEAKETTEAESEIAEPIVEEPLVADPEPVTEVPEPEPLIISQEELSALVKEAKDTHEDPLIEVPLREVTGDYKKSSGLGFTEEEAKAYLIGEGKARGESLELDQGELAALLSEPKENDWEVDELEVAGLEAQLEEARKKKTEEDRLERERIREQGVTKKVNENKKRPSQDEVAVSLVDDSDVDAINAHLEELREAQRKELENEKEEDDVGPLDQSEIDALLDGGEEDDAGPLDQSEIDALLDGGSEDSGPLDHSEIDALLDGGGEDSGPLDQSEIDALLDGGGEDSGSLDQSEIDALLDGGDDSQEESGVLSQDDIDALLNGDSE